MISGCKQKVNFVANNVRDIKFCFTNHQKYLNTFRLRAVLMPRGAIKKIERKIRLRKWKKRTKENLRRKMILKSLPESEMKKYWISGDVQGQCHLKWIEKFNCGLAQKLLFSLRVKNAYKAKSSKINEEILRCNLFTRRIFSNLTF